MMEVLEARRNDILVLALKGCLSATSVPSVLNHLQKRIDQGERQLAVDAAGLTYISSSGLRLLLQVAKQLEERSGRIVLCALQEPVKRVLKNCRIYVAIQHIQLVGGRHSGLSARLTLVSHGGDEVETSVKFVNLLTCASPKPIGRQECPG
jgi:anti-anti-sigma factor